MLSKTTLLLGFFFIIALTVRFMFFPNNVYFGYDQARDSYNAIEVLKGNLKIIGPPSSLNENLFHGPLIYYIYAPVYYLFNLNPEAVAFLFRVINAFGVLLVFAVGLNVFNKEVGLISSLLFAISFEQTQYSLFLSHPALAVLTVLLYYFGLSLLIFKDNPRGLIIAAIGFGLSVQFHFVNLFLLLGFLGYLVCFHKIFFQVKTKWILLSLISLLLTISTFIIAEFKFNFRGMHVLTKAGSSFLDHTEKSNTILSSMKLVISRFFHDNFVSYSTLIILLMLAAVLIAFKLLTVKSLRQKIIFLLIWTMTGLIPYIISGTTSYYYSPAASVSLIIFISYLIYSVTKTNMFMGGLLVFMVVINNLNLIFTQNMKGPNPDIVIQPGMMTLNEKKVLDYCYTKSEGKNFSVNALTVPLYINTTWSYLFEWYGEQKYGYLPVWGGKNVLGFPGNLKLVDKRSDLPDIQCLIIEPTVGIEEWDKKSFLTEEDYFSTISEEKQFGTFTVQLRRKI